MTATENKAVMDPTVELLTQVGYNADELITYEQGQAIFDALKDKLVEMGPEVASKKGYSIDHARFLIEHNTAILPSAKSIEDIIDMESIVKVGDPGHIDRMVGNNYLWLNMDGFNGYWAHARPTPEMRAAMAGSILSDQSVYLDLKSRAIDEGKQRIRIQYNHIIGSRLVSRIDADRVEALSKHLDALPFDDGSAQHKKSAPRR